MSRKTSERLYRDQDVKIKRLGEQYKKLAAQHARTLDVQAAIAKAFQVTLEKMSEELREGEMSVAEYKAASRLSQAVAGAISETERKAAGGVVH